MAQADDAATEDASKDLSSITLLAEVNPERLRAYAQKCQWLNAKRGQQVLSRDSDNRDVFFVLSGKLRIVNFGLSGREVAFATAEPGDTFGEMSAIDGQPRTASVVALEACRLASMDPETFREMLEGEPTVAMGVIERLVRIVRSADERIMDLATLSAYQRIYTELLRLMRNDPVRPNSWLIYPLPTQAQIAARAGTTRETVARVVGQLANAEIVERKSKTLYIRDVDRLRALAERISPGEPPADDV